MQKTCRQCQQTFAIEDRDEAFYRKMQVPLPTLCPNCRFQRRLAWRIERNLYMRKCDKTGRDMISIFPPDHPNKIYHHEAWYSDAWSALDYGRDYDFSRPFFAQFGDLLREVPLLSANVLALQNCDFVNQCGWSKNCYMTIEADHNEDSMYSYRIFYVKNCVDCTEVVHSERCYECTDCEQCFRLRNSQLCEQCNDSAFLFDCRSCSNCFGCTGLRQKKHCMFNEQLSKEEYEARLKTFDFCNRKHLTIVNQKWATLKLKHPRKAFIGEQNENVTGNYIFESKDCSDCFDIRACRDCRFCHLIRDANDCMDYLSWGDNTCERLYECQECGMGAHNVRFCSSCYEGLMNILYCFQCVLTVSNCFGCIGLKKKEYCILNKEYTKQEYEELVPRIIAHMKETGEWGEFFPIELSPNDYNETAAQEIFPLTREEVQSHGWKWQENISVTCGKETISWKNIPENIAEVPDSIVNEILACEATGKNYRITKQELAFYRAMRIPLPRLHPDERHRRRMALRNPNILWKRTCVKCQTPIETTYAPERSETVLCEQCYLKTVY